ncbi:hypothetical protein MNBD_GAMMA05-2116 [hydrothermal vent metagenome]|uniref:GIY-YIG domain-containing protein n=1 Tax=hydrothermal vent metagenome TaxID=652676 RepID=A0A3B0WI74_9ZZZZ
MNGKTIVFSGATKNPYLFTVYPWDASLVTYGAVYVVLRRDRFGYSIIYIGRTGELSPHLSRHPLLKAFIAAGRTHVGVHLEPVISKRYAKQMDLVTNFSPDLNGGGEIFDKKLPE